MVIQFFFVCFLAEYWHHCHEKEGQKTHKSQDLVPELDRSLVPSSSDMPVTPHWNSNFFHTPSWVSPCLKLWVFSVLWWPFCCCLLSKLCFFPNIQNIYQFLSSSRFSAEKRKNVTLEKKIWKQKRQLWSMLYWARK